MAGAKHAGAEQIYYINGSEHEHTGEGTCSTHYDRRRTLQSSLLVLAQRRDAIYLYYVLSGLADAIEVAIIRQFGRYPPSAVDDQAISLRATHQLVEGARIKKDETRWTAFGDRPKLPRLDDRLRHRTRHRDCIAEWMIEVQNSYGLTEGIHHVMIAIGMERIAAIVTRDRDWYAAVAHFVDRRDAAPTWGPPIAPILKIKIDGWQRHYRDARLGAEDEGPAYLLFRLDGQAAAMAAHHATLESVAQHCSGDMRERRRRRVAALVYMQIDIETAF